MDFLGNSQTFVGVLASLVVLCILDSGNFILGILKKIGERIDGKIKRLDKRLDLQGKIGKLKPYQSFQSFIETSKEKEREKKLTDKEDELKKEALALEMNLQATFSAFKSDLTPEFIIPARSLIKKIKDSREQLIAPLYVLLYSIVVFICDEIVRAKLVDIDWIVTFLSVFTAFSFVFWGMVWLAFYNGIRIESKATDKKKKRNYFEKWICKNVTWKIAFSILAIYCLFPICSCWLAKGTEVNWYGIILGLSLFIGTIVSISVCRVRSHKLLGRYLYMFSLRHFGGLFIVSLLITLTLFFCTSFYREMTDYFIIYEDCIAIKAAIIAFIIINGLFLPFWMPYVGYNRVFKIVKEASNREASNFKDKVNELNKQLDEFDKKIKTR